MSTAGLHAGRGSAPLQLVRPAPGHLESYVAALRGGWSADTTRGTAAALDDLQRIEADPEAFLASLEDREARGAPIQLPDGSLANRLPGFRRWMWDGTFCGSIGLRWQPGTPEPPSYTLGHIGYSVVPWRRREGLATQALRQMLPLAWEVGLAFVDITTDPGNTASQRVIEANGGILVDSFTKPVQFGATPGLRYRIHRTES